MAPRGGTRARARVSGPPDCAGASLIKADRARQRPVGCAEPGGPRCYDRPVIAAVILLVSLPLHPLSGLRLDEAISILQHEGLTVIYSTALVRPEMRVEREPLATTLRGKLEEILAPHGLRVIEGPHHELLVIAAPKAPERPSPPPRKTRFRDEIVVMPSQTRILNETAASTESLPSDAISRIPDPSGDPGRVLQHLPGIASMEASSAVNIRGSSADETMITVDGLELSEPFHLKDFFSVFTTLDSTAIGEVDLMTGAFPVEWGDRIGGVVDINLVSPSAPASTTVSVGTLNSRLSSTGMTSDGSTTWLLTARGWYPDAIFSIDREPTQQTNIDFYDILGKVEHRFTPRTTASLTFLGAYDNLGYKSVKPEGSDQSVAEETSDHLWLTMQTTWSEATSVRTILAVGRLSRARTGSSSGEDTLQVTDNRGFDFVELKQDWRAAHGDRQQLRFGFEAKSADAYYDYTRSVGQPTPLVDIHIRPHARSFALYASDRVRLNENVMADLGLRWDRQTLPTGSQLSPRVNLLWRIGPNSDLRLGWGRYTQSERLNELPIEDGVSRFSRPELGEHRTVSFEHRFENGLKLRIEAFDRPMTRVRVRFENRLNPIDVFPEAQDDRVRVAPSRSRANGVELRMSGTAGPRAAWWIGYVRSRATDTVNGRTVPRSWDQPHAAAGGVSFELPGAWSVGLAAAYHTGWPTTPFQAIRTPAGLELVAGERNSARLPNWFRLDASVRKSIPTRHGTLFLGLDIVNLTNHRNVCCISDLTPFERSDGSIGLKREDRSLVPLFPLLSVRWNH
jgi:outer membrane cobalamin receptor